jgi:hypothetical protein
VSRRSVNHSKGSVIADYRHETYCGLYCGACPILAANRAGDEKQLAAWAAEWKKPVEDLRCRGCYTDLTAVFCRDCEIRDCARARGLTHCGLCHEFPCRLLESFRDDDAAHHSVVVAASRRRALLGDAAWLQRQRTRWSCPDCGRGFTWYQNRCPECNSDLYDCRAEEADLAGEIEGPTP